MKGDERTHILLSLQTFSLQCWLDKLKPIQDQAPKDSMTFFLKVKFYAADPTLLEDDLTR